MRILALSLTGLALLAPVSALAASTQPSAPVQAAPSSPSQPSVAPPGAPSKIPIPSSPESDPEALKQEKAAAKRQKEQLYAFLVIGATLLPIAALALWRFWPRTQPQQRSRHRYSAGPADPRRIRRRNQRK